MRLMEIVNRKKVSIQMTKVKTYSKDSMNEKVDKLAKEGRNFPEIQWKDPKRPLWHALSV